MTKADMVSAFAEATDLTKIKAADCLKKLMAIMAQELNRSGKVPLPYMGKLKVVQRAARTGRNPKTGKSISIPAKKAAKYSPSKAVKDAINQQ